MGVLDEYIATEYVTQEIKKSGDTQFTSVNAEETVLRRMLASQDVAEDIATVLSGKDFSNVDYGRLFNSIQDVIRQDRHVDAITVEDSATRLFPKSAKRLRDVLVVLTKYKEPTVDDSHGVEDYVAIIRSLSIRRNAAKTLGELIKQIYNPEKDISETMVAIREAVDNSGVDNGGSVSLQDVLMRTYEYLERKQKGEITVIQTGLSSLDKLIGGFYGGELTVIGARPSVGKSAFAQYIALSAAGKGHKVGFVSCEMVDIGFGQRIFANTAHVDGMDIRKGEIDDDGWSRLSDALLLTNDMTIDFKFDSTYIEDIVQWATKKARRGEMDMLIVDYLQLVDVRRKFDSDHLRVGYISRTLKRLATQLNIPVIALAQVNRETDGSMPTLKHLKDSGSIEQDCDGVLFLHRPKDENDPCIEPRDKPYFAGFAEQGLVYLCIGVAKQRQGAIGKVSVAFRPQFTEFTAISRE